MSFSESHKKSKRSNIWTIYLLVWRCIIESVESKCTT